MSNLYFFKQIHNAAVITSPEANQVFPLAGYASMQYRLRITAAAGGANTLVISINTQDLNGNFYQIYYSGAISNVNQISAFISPIFGSIVIRYIFVSAGYNYTVTDEVEAVG